jgi:hypothetical protein
MIVIISVVKNQLIISSSFLLANEQQQQQQKQFGVFFSNCGLGYDPIKEVYAERFVMSFIILNLLTIFIVIQTIVLYKKN